ncbi:MAG: beta-galactosidase, partial [Lachnospiraceae bacterium]|nr:beta-galactosidase [Lachnospiraceae bacterium]
MRNTINFNDNWLFSKDNIQWENVTLPHTWNAVDGMNGKGEYYRGECFYAKEFATPPLYENTKVYLEILAASLSSKVLLNDVEIGIHERGFSSYTVDLTPHLSKSGVNHLVIRVDNSERSHIYPQMADFTFYG